jgi:hypothetical protein
MSPVLQIVVASFAAGGYALKWWFEPRRRARRALAAAREARLADVRNGDRPRVTGVAQALERSLTSPVGRRPCIGFQLIIEEKVPGDNDWRVALSRSECTPFGLRDGAAEAVIVGPFMLGLDPDDRGDIWANLPPSLFALLEEAEVPLTGMFGRDKAFRFREALLEPGDRITVLGRVFLEPEPHGLRDGLRGPPMRCAFKGVPGEPVVVSDADELEVP